MFQLMPTFDPDDIMRKRVYWKIHYYTVASKLRAPILVKMIGATALYSVH